MTTTETRHLPTLIDGCLQAVKRLQFARSVDPDHPVIPTLPHAIDCDICSSGRRVDMLLDEISSAIGKATP